MNLKDFPSLDHPQDDSNKSDNEEDMDDTPDTEGKKTDCPCNDKDDCNNIKQVTHDTVELNINYNKNDISS